MKFIGSIILTTLLATTAFAETETIQGKEAEVLYSALGSAGAVDDCGAGHCGTSASEVTCAQLKFSNKPAVCTLKIQDKFGDLKARRLKGKRAEHLIEALINVGVVNCGMESCSGAASTIDCHYPNDPSGGHPVECSIQ